MNFRTQRFELRSLIGKNLEPAYFEWLQDPEINRYLNIYGTKLSKESIRRYVDSHMEPDDHFFGIYDLDNKMIGTHSFRYSPLTRRCAVGGMIGDKSYWGKGVILETRATLLSYAFDDRDCFKVEAVCYKENLAAIYNFLRQGWTKEGVFRAHRTINGTSEDLIMFGLLKEEWDGRRQV